MGNTVAGHVPSKSLSDYENEILMLRSEMEQLHIKLGEAETKIHVNTHQNRTSGLFRAEEDARQVVGRLVKEEDYLRRGPLEPQNLVMGDKEKMIQMQQQKIAALDETNSRLIEELNRLGEQLNTKQHSGGSSVVLRPQASKANVSSFGGPASTLVSVTTTPQNSSTGGLEGTGSGPGGATTITSINMSSNSVSTSPHPSSSSCGSAPRRFGSPSSTISSSSSVSSGSGHHHSSIPVKSPNRSITVISNGQTAFIPPNASSGVSSIHNGGNTTTLTLPIGDSSAKSLLGLSNNAVNATNSASVAMQSVQETPKTVDELLDSLHSTPI